jgi:hypothetical protein
LRTTVCWLTGRFGSQLLFEILFGPRKHWTADWIALAGTGARVIGIDRFNPPHAFGSSHGETRITRQAIGEGQAYVPLVVRSNQILDLLGSEFGEPLIERTY